MYFLTDKEIMHCHQYTWYSQLTRKRASTALNMLRSMSAPTTVLLLMTTRLLHTATPCFSLLLQRRADCCSGSNWPSCTGLTPCSSAYIHPQAQMTHVATFNFDRSNSIMHHRKHQGRACIGGYFKGAGRGEVATEQQAHNMVEDHIGVPL